MNREERRAIGCWLVQAVVEAVLRSDILEPEDSLRLQLGDAPNRAMPRDHNGEIDLVAFFREIDGADPGQSGSFAPAA